MTIPTFSPVAEQVTCYHCGEICPDIENTFDEKHFCCDGCKAVYQMLNSNGLCGYYDIDDSKGISPKIAITDERFAYLEDPATILSIVSFQNETETQVTLSLPQMHCSSCVWLLEHLYKLNPGILRSQTDFIRKQLFVVFDHRQTSLRKVVELVTTLGYEPSFQYADLEKKKAENPNRKRIHRLTVAGFCFGNIMLLSFPEYLGTTGIDASMTKLFGYLNLILALPTLVFSGGEFFVSAWQGLKAKFLNIDLPLSLSIAITFGRSVYEILSGTGPGYFDSMAGIIFFMLLGRYFQDRKQVQLQFDRDFKSFFPISVRRVIPNGEDFTTIPLSNLSKGNRIIIRSSELIPADSILRKGDARIDYSFVTGESKPEHVKVGQIVYAGGRQTCGEIELEVVNEVEQSYLTQLWNRENKKDYKSNMDNMVHRLARHFTLFLLLLSLGSFIFWLPTDINRGIHALSTILIVACPCALLLSATFTHASILSVLGKNGVFVKNATLLEKIGEIKHIVWDKTGTLTSNKINEMSFEGDLTAYEKNLVYRAATQSNHPVSRGIVEFLEQDPELQKARSIHYSISDFNEEISKGYTADVAGHIIKIGSAEFVGLSAALGETLTRGYVNIDGHVKGYFALKSDIRPGLADNIISLRSEGYKQSILSGDHAIRRTQFEVYFGNETPMMFGKTPHEKEAYIEQLQSEGEKVMMIGDGLNDAGALIQSNIGMAVSDDVNNFTPACDVIMEGKSFPKFHTILEYIGTTKAIIIASFIISLLYNVVGLGIAVQGKMSPLIAAILMPLSSFSIIIFTTTTSRIIAKIKGLRTV
ncbi:MAG: heavy metal translocating P-type ATPase metal-binding domain-containing protein [Flavobacteriales bacterium]